MKPNRKSFLAILQPRSAWIAILGFVFCSALLILGGAGVYLNLIFPFGALVVGAFLYFRAPILYLGFVWWLCFLSPLVRRLVDYRSGFTEPSPILLAPFLVVFITLITLYRNFPKAHRQGGLPFVICFCSIFWGICLGLAQGASVSAIVEGIKWLSPVLLGFHIFVNWQYYPKYRQNMLRVFLWGVLLMGIYGIFQYLTAPDWDVFWLRNSGMRSLGVARPLGIRVWSTMSSPTPFGMFMMVGLIMLINQTGFLSIYASTVGYLAILLSRSRTAWVGWFIALIAMFFTLKSKYQIRLILIIMTLSALIIPIMNTEAFSEHIGSRLETLSSLEDDTSAQARLGAYGIFLDNPLLTLLGYGIGNVPGLLAWDSGILIIFFALGWVGAIVYLGGLLKPILELWQFSQLNVDPFISTSSAICISFLLMLTLASCHIDLAGLCFWGFLGLGLAARKYYRNLKYS